MSTAKQGAKNFGSLLISVLFIMAGVITLYDTTHYGDIDSKVFPRAAAIALILFATLALLAALLKPDSSASGFGSGSWWRRCLLVMSMLLACFTLPYFGFLLSGVIAFTGGLLAAMHDRWSLSNALSYTLSGGAIMVAFYALFRYALHVPLP